MTQGFPAQGDPCVSLSPAASNRVRPADLAHYSAAVTVTADDLDAAVSCLADTLGPAAGQDWLSQPGTGEWNCWHTAEHIGDCLLSYAAQLVARPDARYVRFMAVADKDASPAEVPRSCGRRRRPRAPITPPAWPTRPTSQAWAASKRWCTARTSPAASA